jgi:phospholipid N-methyltransferase
MKTLAFIKESIRNLKTVGTITKSSVFLCRGVVKQVDFSESEVVVELGAGDGVITKHILRSMSPNSKLLAFEVNEKFCKQLENINDPRLIVIQDSAEHLEKYLEENHLNKIDAVISAIPFVIFTEEKAHEIIETCKEHMKKKAPFVQVHYSLLARKMYRSIFGNVKTNFIPLNLPPAFVLVSRKEKETVAVTA